MSKTTRMTNKEVLLAAGVTEEQISAIDTADSAIAVNTLSAIHQTCMAFVNYQKIVWADLKNPLESLEQAYSTMNGGELNGHFTETFIPANPKGDGLYGGYGHNPKAVKNYLAEQNWGNKPTQYTFGINASISREVDYNTDDFYMYFKKYSMIDFIRSQVAVLEANANASAYFMENSVLNCEDFQYLPYATAESFKSASDLNNFIGKVFDSQKFPEANTKYKKSKFNTTRRDGELVLIMQADFLRDFTNKFEFKSYLKPFISRTMDQNGYISEGEKSRIVLVDELTPTTLKGAQEAREILNPQKPIAATLPEGKKIVGRIIDTNAIKFGPGKFTSIEIPANDRVMHYAETRDYCINLCDSYVNVPLLIDSDYTSERIISVQNVAAAK